MAQIITEIPPSKEEIVKDAFAARFPIPTDGGGLPHQRIGNPLFTKAQWVKECINRFVRTTVHQYKIDQAVAANVNTIPVDDGVAS